MFNASRLFYRFDECISVFNDSVYFTSYLFFHRIA